MTDWTVRGALGLMLALAGCVAPEGDRPAAPSHERPLKIATWNLEHLAEENGTGCRPRTGADYAQLRGYAEALDADIVALQEVESKAAAERVFDPASYTVVMSARPGSGRSSECYGRKGLTIRRQAVGFAIRKDVRFTRNPDLTALGLGDPDLRWGVDVTIASRNPVRLLAIHLKSGCHSGRSETDADCAVLFGQLPVLEQWIDDRARHRTAFIVLGDWNRRIGQRKDLFYAEIDDGEPAGADLAIAAGAQQARCKERYPEFIDHIVFGADAGGRLIDGSFEEFSYGVAEPLHPSDHCPVSITLGE